MSQHPAVAKASLLHTIAETLAGGPRYTTSIDPATGTTTRTKVPLSRADIGMAIAMSAISGGLAGLSQRGPGATGRAAEAGFQQVVQQRQQAQQQQDQQAQQDATNQANALVRSASIHEQNARTVLATQQGERLGIDALKDAVEQNAPLLQSYDDAGAVGDKNVTQDALLDGMRKGQYDGTKVTALPDGWTNVNGQWEQTFSIVTKPSVKVMLDQDTVDRFAAGHVQGYPKGMTVPAAGYPVPGYMIAKANLQLQANKMMLQEAGDVAKTLSQSGDPDNKELAKSIPDLGKLMDDEKQGLALQNSLPKLAKYMHHDGSGDDLYQAVVAMSQSQRPSPTNPKQMIDNSSDAKAAQVILSAFGNGDATQGIKVLRAYHDAVTPAPIKSEAEAESTISDPASTPREVAQAKRYLAISQATKANEAGAEARAKKAAGGSEDATAGNPALIESNPIGGVNQRYLNSLPAGQRAIVQAIGEGRQEGPNTRTKEGKALSEVVNNAYPDYDGTRYHTYQAMQKDFVSGKTSQGLVALNTALSHLNMLYDNANLGSTLPLVSGVERFAGNSSAVALKNAQVAVSDELGKAYKSGVVTESERKDWMNQLSGWTPANVKQSAVAFAHLLDGKISAYEQTLRNGAPSGAVKLPALMSPEAGAAYTHITGEAPTTTVGTRTAQVQPPVAGAIAGRDAAGRIVAWKLPNGTVQRVQ
jgi:hypothetical protein